MIAENRPGATGSIGLDFVAKSPPDGYTLGVLIISHAVHAAVDGARMPYDLARDFTPVVQFSSNPYLLVVHPSVPAKSVAQLVALARAKPGLCVTVHRGPAASSIWPARGWQLRARLK